MSLNLILKFINYKLTAYSEHDVHSPFVFDFYVELIKNKNPFKDFEELDLIRTQLLSDETTLNITDFGVGSKRLKSNQRKIKEIAKNGMAQKKQAQQLHNSFQPWKHGGVGAFCLRLDCLR